MTDSRPTCAFCRVNRGDAFLHDDPTANVYRCGVYWVICLDCVELMIERENALAIHPELAWMLPDIWGRPPRTPKRPQGVIWSDHTKDAE